MSLILHIETATKNCSVSLSKQGKLVRHLNFFNIRYSHAEQLHPLILSVFEETPYTLLRLNAVAVSKGPGSYTGLRIGVSTAKGLCFGLDIPLIAIDSLSILAHAIEDERFDFIIPMLDARRMEVYTAVFDRNKQPITTIQALIIDDDFFPKHLSSHTLLLGDGVEKGAPYFSSKGCEMQVCYPSAEHMVKLAYTKFMQQEFEDVAYFEPFYLKDFMALPSKNMLRQG